MERLGIGRGYLHVMLTFADSDREAADSYELRQHSQLITWPITDHCGVCIITHLSTTLAIKSDMSRALFA